MEKQTIRVRRVGSVTFGVVLVATGVLYLLQRCLPALNFMFIFRLWPLMLILLGVEVLAGSRNKNVSVLDKSGSVVEQNKVVYDVAAILLTVVMVGFALGMAVMDYGITHHLHL